MSEPAGAEAALRRLCPPAAFAQLSSYVSLLERWTKRVDLIAPASQEEIFERHILDSALAVEVLSESAPWGSLLDVGSGAGLPGLVAAVLRPQSRVLLLEPRSRRCEFLKEARRVLKLENVSVIEGRIETLKLERPVEVLTSRALGRTELLMQHANFILVKGGRLAELVGPSWLLDQQLASKYPDFRFEGELSYELPHCGTRGVAVWKHG